MQPTMLFKSGGPYRGPNGTSYQCTGASTEEELALLLARGWFTDKMEALGLQPVKRKAGRPAKVKREET